jgi:hypothetical protein
MSLPARAAFSTIRPHIVGGTHLDIFSSLERTHVVDARQFDLCRNRLHDCAGSGRVCYTIIAALCPARSVKVYRCESSYASQRLSLERFAGPGLNAARHDSRARQTAASAVDGSDRGAATARRTSPSTAINLATRRGAISRIPRLSSAARRKESNEPTGSSARRRPSQGFANRRYCI